MRGAIIGDMASYGYDSSNIKTKKFDMFNPLNKMSDDALLTIEAPKALLDAYPLSYDEASLAKLQRNVQQRFSKVCCANPDVGWGCYFLTWAHLSKDKQKSYVSFGKRGAMRVSPVAWAANNLDEVKLLSKAITEITHNDPEGLKGAEAIAVSVFLARTGRAKAEIAEYIYHNYYPEIITFDYKSLVKTYSFNTMAKESVPHAIFCFL